MKNIQQQVTVLRMQQQQREDKVEELQVESEQITGIIHPRNQKVQ